MQSRSKFAWHIIRNVFVLSVILFATFSAAAQNTDIGVVYIVENNAVIQQNDNTFAINVFGTVRNSFSQDIADVVIGVTLSDGTHYSVTISSMRSGASSPFVVTGPVTAGAGSYSIYVESFRLTSTNLNELLGMFWSDTNDVSVRDAAVRAIAVLPASSFEAVSSRFVQTAPFEGMISNDLIEDLVLMDYLGRAQSPLVAAPLLAMSQVYSLPTYQLGFDQIRTMAAGGSTIIPLLDYAYANSYSLEDLLIYTMQRNSPHVLPPLIEAAYNESSMTQAFAIRTLSTLGYPTLADALNVNSADIRANIIRVLGRINSPDVLMPLVRHAEQSPLDREQIMNSLVSWQGEITSEFVEMLNAPDPHFRAMVAQIMTQRGERDLVVLQDVSVNLGALASPPPTAQDALAALDSYYAAGRAAQVAALWEQAQAAYETGDCASASNVIDSMRSVDQGLDAYYGQIVPILLCAGRVQDAVQLFTAYMANSPDLTGFAAAFTVGEMQVFAEELRNAAHYDQAIAFLQSAQTVFPDAAANELTVTYLIQASALRAEGRINAADSAVTQAKNSAPTPTVFFLALIRALVVIPHEVLALLVLAGLIFVLSYRFLGVTSQSLRDQSDSLIASGLFGSVIAFLAVTIHTPHIETGSIINAALGILTSGALCFGAGFFTRRFSLAALVFSLIAPIIVLILLYSTGHDLGFLVAAGVLGFLPGIAFGFFAERSLVTTPLFAAYLGFNLIPFAWSVPGADHLASITLFAVAMFAICAFFTLNSGSRPHLWRLTFFAAAIGGVLCLTRIYELDSGVIWLGLGVIGALLWHALYRLLRGWVVPLVVPLVFAAAVTILSSYIPWSLQTQLPLAAFAACVFVVVMNAYLPGQDKKSRSMMHWAGVLFGTVVWHTSVKGYSLTAFETLPQTILSAALPLGIAAFFLPALWNYLQSPQRRFVMWDANRMFSELHAQQSPTHMPQSWHDLKKTGSDNSLSEHIAWMFASSELFSQQLDELLQEFNVKYLQQAPEAWQHLVDVLLDFREGQIPAPLLRYIRFVIWYEFLAHRSPTPNSEFGAAFLNQEWAQFAELRRAALTNLAATTGLTGMLGINGASLLELPKVINQRGVILLSATDDMLGTAGWRERIAQMISPEFMKLQIPTLTLRVVKFDGMLSEARTLRNKLLALFEDRAKDPELQIRMRRVLDASYVGIDLMQTAVNALCDQGVGFEVIELTNTFMTYAFSQQVASELNPSTNQNTQHIMLLDQAFRAYDAKAAHALYNLVINRGWVKDAVPPNLQTGKVNLEGKLLEILNTTFQEPPLVVIARTPDSIYAFDLPPNHGRVIPLMPGDYEIIVLLQTSGFAPGRFRFTYQENAKTIGWMAPIAAPFTFNMPQLSIPPLGRIQ